MSKVDRLLTMVESLAQRSDRIVSLIEESNTLISLIFALNSSIAAADTQIDSMTELLNKNNLCLNEFEKLGEKSFFLESNIHANDRFTTEMSLENLKREYDYLLHNYKHHNRRFALEEKPEQDNTALKNMLSISNLNLKPIRCSLTRVSKQKSRYRLSSAYTFNPLANSRSTSKSSNESYDSVMELTFAGNSDTSYNGSTPSVEEKNSPQHRGLSPFTTDATEEHNHNFESHTTNDNYSLHSYHLLEVGNVTESPKASFTNMDSLDINDMDSCSDSSLDLEESPSKLDADNFHHFLRQSRIDMRTAFPNVEISLPEESIFLEKAPIQSHKFHNPATILHTQKGISQPTVEPIYSSSFDKNPDVSHFKEHSRKLLQPENSPTKPVTPKRKNFTIFNLLNSPLGSPRMGLSIDRRQSTGVSISSSFMQLVGPIDSKPSPPEKIKRLKKGLRDPIQITNETNSKRMPPPDRQLRHGSHSSLTIANKTKIINHGGASLFKKPPVRRLSHLLLTSALHDSLLY